MFSKSGILELHAVTHERLDLLIQHVGTIPRELWNKSIDGFGRPTVLEQLVHILTCEEGWVCDLQSLPFPGWTEEGVPTMGDLIAQKKRVFEATRKYVDSLTEGQLNATLTTRPLDWGGS